MLVHIVLENVHRALVAVLVGGMDVTASTEIVRAAAHIPANKPYIRLGNTISALPPQLIRA